MRHTLDAHHAQVLGHLPAAVLFESIQYWVEKNKANGKNFRDGRYWTYSSIKSFRELFPYITIKQLRFAKDLLFVKGYIDLDQQGFNQTLWYTLGDGIIDPPKRLKHVFDPAIVKKTGSIQAAILFENIRHWVHKNKSMEINFVDGMYWTYSSTKAFTELLPYLTKKQVRTAIDKLIQKGLIVRVVVDNYSRFSLGPKLLKTTYV